MQGGPLGHELDKNELLLKKTQGSNGPTRLVATVANYTSRSAFTKHLLHLERKKVFGSTKQPINCPFGINNDSHWFDCMNFSCQQVTIPTTKPHMVEDVCIQQPSYGSNNLLPLVFWGDLVLKESIFVDG